MPRNLLCTSFVALLLIGCTHSDPPPGRTSPIELPGPQRERQDASRPGPDPRPSEVDRAPAQRVVDAEQRVTASEATAAALPKYAIALPERSAIVGFHTPPATIDRERYTHFDDNPVHVTREDPVSTFSIDVDTAAYANVRRLLNHGVMPDPDAVRTEELVNYFDYSYAPSTDRQRPFTVHTELGPSPWHRDRQLLHIGLKGLEHRAADLPPANLVFLVDVSGSMQSPDKIDLLKASLKLLIHQLRPIDRIALVVYAGAAGTVLDPTPGDQKARILTALDGLTAGGSTNGAAGIQLAYLLARQHRSEGGIDRVILATDGDFNVGTVDQTALKHLIERERADGIGLTVLGFGTGNYNDALMQELAQAGNGNAAYIDSLNEGRKVLVEEMGSTLEIIASDVKIQVEFNPDRVDEYRLVGYETRHLEREDFNNDRVDAGDIGAGHTVTALYEITPAGSEGRLIDPLRYQSATDRSSKPSAEVAFVRLRYKLPGESASRLIERPVRTDGAATRLADTSVDFRFAAAVAGFGQLLRGGRYTDDFGYGDVLALARGARGEDPFGYRGEFFGLVSTAAALRGVQLGQN